VFLLAALPLTSTCGIGETNLKLVKGKLAGFAAGKLQEEEAYSEGSLSK
jgi:hypothetical protein